MMTTTPTPRIRAISRPSAPHGKNVAGAWRRRSFVVDRTFINNRSNGAVENKIEKIEEDDDDKPVEECRKNLPGFHF
jgi:hypothetical protein